MEGSRNCFENHLRPSQLASSSLSGVTWCATTALSASDRAAGFNLGLVQQLFRSENKNSFLFSSTTFANTKKGKSLLRFCRKSCEIIWHPFFVVQNASRKKNRKILPSPFPPLNSRPTPSVARSSSISAARSPNEPSRQTLRLFCSPPDDSPIPSDCPRHVVVFLPNRSPAEWTSTQGAWL